MGRDDVVDKAQGCCLLNKSLLLKEQNCFRLKCVQLNKKKYKKNKSKKKGEEKQMLCNKKGKFKRKIQGKD